MHFLRLEPRETDNNVLKFTKNLVVKLHFLLLGPLRLLQSCMVLDCSKLADVDQPEVKSNLGFV